MVEGLIGVGALDADVSEVAENKRKERGDKVAGRCEEAETEVTSESRPDRGLPTQESALPGQDNTAEVDDDDTSTADNLPSRARGKIHSH